MKKYIILSFVGALSLLSSCDYNDKYFDGLDDLVTPTNKLALEYTLTGDDYASISTLKPNTTLATTNGVSSALAAIKTNKYLSDAIPAADYVPAFLASKWYSASKGAAIKVTYKKSVNQSDNVVKLNDTSKNSYTISTANYKSIWGANSSVNFFTPSKTAASYIPEFLTSALPSAVSGDIVAVNYNESTSEPTTVAALSEDFESMTVATIANVANWTNVITTGTYSWAGKSYNSNKYIQASAYKHTGDMEVYMISPSVTVTAGQLLSFDACFGNYTATGGKLSVLISSNLAGTTTADIAAATWDDVTENFSIPIPSGTYGTLGKVGEASLSKYVGKKIYIAFRYNGNGTTGATTTVQVDNVTVAKSGGSYTSTGTLYTFNGTKWVTYTGNAYFLTKADFAVMGSKYDNFSSTMSADNYVPQFLKQKHPYAQEGDAQVVVYKYFASSTTVRADEYIYTAGTWVKNNSVEEFTDQFVYTGSKWVYDPSVVIDLKPGKNQPAVAVYYQAIANYVGKTFGTGYYQTNYTNAECYYGSSAFYNEFDFRPSFIRTGSIEGVSAYASLDDEALGKLMVQRLPEALMHALEAVHPTAIPVSGVDVTYTINFGVYTGTTISAPNYTIVYKVTGTGKFEYVANSLKAL